LVLGIVLAGVVGVLAVILAGSGVYLYRIDHSVNANINRGIELPTDWGSSTAEARPVKTREAAEALNYVLIGSDDGDPSLDRDGRSDSIMLVHLNQKRNQAYIISFPRNMYVKIPGHGRNRINAAYEIGGPALVVRTLESLTGSRMDHVAMIDFEGFVSLTEDLDGVTVNNRTAFSSHGHIYPKGRITLSGDRALWFVRERNALPSELDRAENQRNMLNAILTKGLSAEVVSDPVRFTSFVANAAKRIKVDNDLTQTEIRSTMLSLRLRPKNLVMMQAPLGRTDRIAGQEVHRVDERRMAEFGKALKNDKMAEYLNKYPRG
jgi:LCP family protein required for cell wall assembly